MQIYRKHKVTRAFVRSHSSLMTQITLSSPGIANFTWRKVAFSVIVESGHPSFVEWQNGGIYTAADTIAEEASSLTRPISLQEALNDPSFLKLRRSLSRAESCYRVIKMKSATGRKVADKSEQTHLQLYFQFIHQEIDRLSETLRSFSA